MSIGPITPQEATSCIIKIPDLVIQAFNELIVEKIDRTTHTAYIRQDEAVEKILATAHKYGVILDR